MPSVQLRTSASIGLTAGGLFAATSGGSTRSTSSSLTAFSNHARRRASLLASQRRAAPSSKQGSCFGAAATRALSFFDVFQWASRAPSRAPSGVGVFPQENIAGPSPHDPKWTELWKRYVRTGKNNPNAGTVHKLLLPFWHCVYLYDNLNGLPTILSARVCAGSPDPKANSLFLRFYQLTDVQEFIAPEPIDEVEILQGQLGAYTPVLSTRPFDPRVADDPDGPWRIIPFSFGLPTVGLDKSLAPQLRLRHRFAFPTYQRTIWVPDGISFGQFLETCVGSIEERHSIVQPVDLRFRGIPILGGNHGLHQVTSLHGTWRSPLQPSVVNTTIRENLNWTSPVLLTAVASDSTAPQTERVRVAETIKAMPVSAKAALAEKAQVAKRQAAIRASKELERSKAQAARKAKADADAIVRAKAERDLAWKAEAKAKEERKLAWEAGAEERAKQEPAAAKEKAAQQAKRMELFLAQARAKEAHLEKVQAAIRSKQAALLGKAALGPTPTRPTPTRPTPTRPARTRVAAPSPSPPPSRSTVFADPDGYYTLLGFSVRTFKALPSDDDVRNARNKQLRIWHPDVSSGDTERTQRINEAYDRLATAAQRRAYGRGGA